MGSTFSGLIINQSSLSAYQTALNTVGHNIANSDNPHYARQSVKLHSMPPLYAPSANRMHAAGQLGQGVKVATIERIRNHFYDDQIMKSENSSNYWQKYPIVSKTSRKSL